MPEILKSPYLFSDAAANTENAVTSDDKVANLSKARDEKINRFTQKLSYETVTLESFHDVDSPGFADVTGGLGATLKDGTTYDRTGKKSLDRVEGFDAYEVFPDYEGGVQYHNEDPNGMKKMARQRARLANDLGADPQTITNEDVYERAARDKLKTLAVLEAYSSGRGEDYIKQVKEWEPSKDLTAQWRTSTPTFGNAENLKDLNIQVERAVLDNYGKYDGFGYYGRPLTSVRPLGSKYLLGEEGAGYTYFDDTKAPRTPVTEEQMYEAYMRAEAENMDVGDRLVNATKAFRRTLAKEVVVDFADWIGEGLNKITGGKIGWDVGTEQEKTRMVDNLFGFNPYAAEDDYKEATALATKVVEGVLYDNKEVNYSDVYDLIKLGVTTPELLGDSIGFIGSFFVPFLGWGGKAAKADKSIRTTQALLKAGKITKEVAKTQVAAAKAEVNVLSKMRKFAQANAGLMQVSAGNVNDQIDAYKAKHGEEPSVGKVAQMMATETLMLSLDRWADLSILKAPAALKGVREAFSALGTEGKTKLLGKTVRVALGLTANAGKEAGQEYLQEIGQEFNVQFNFDDNGTFFSAETLDEAKDVFLAKDMQIVGVTGAGLGAGGSLQFAALGTSGKALRGVGEKIKERKAAKYSGSSTDVTDEDVIAEEDATPGQAAAAVATAEADTDAVVAKYSNMINDEEFTKVFAAETLDEQNAVTTPNLKETLAKNPSEYRNAIDEIERAEAVIQSRIDAGTPKENDELAAKLLRTTKRQVYTNLMEDEEQPTLGSGYTPEDVVEEFLSTVDVQEGNLVMTAEEEKLLADYVKANEIPPLRFDALRNFRTNEKDASQVHEDIYGADERSAVSYRNQLRSLVNTPNPSRKKVSSVVDSINNFLNSQETRKKAYDSVLKEVQANVNNYNKQTRTIPGSVKKELLAGKRIPGYKDAFVAVRENKQTGKLEVHPSSLAVSKSIQDNIDYMQRTKDRYGAQANRILGDDYNPSDVGISVRPNKTHQAARDIDQQFYDKHKVTKAIVDTDSSSTQWATGGDYSMDNSTKINTGTYTADDVIVVNSTAKRITKNSKIAKELNAAYKAGATIVVDPSVRNNKGLYVALNNYHFKPIEIDGVKSFVPKAKADIVNAEQAVVKEAKAADDKLRRDLVIAMDDNDQAGIDAAASLFDGDKDKMQAFYENVVRKTTEKLTTRLTDIALSKGLGSEELNAAKASIENSVAKKEIPKSAMDKAFKNLDETVTRLETGETRLADWTKAHEKAKKGKEDLGAWIKSNVQHPMQIMKDVFANAIGTGKGVSYTYYDKDTKDFKVPKKSVGTIAKDESGRNVPYQQLEMDPNSYAQVTQITPLNSLEAKDLRIKGKEHIAFNAIVDSSKALLAKTLKTPDLMYKGKEQDILDLSDSPAASLIFDKDKNIHDNVAIALNLGLHNFIKNSAYLLKKGKKSKADIAEILGIDESQLSREAVNMMMDKGLLYKTAANSIGRDIVAMLGITQKKDSEADKQAFDSLVVDLGQTALLMGVANGTFETDNSVSAKDFAKTVLGKSKNTIEQGSDAKVLFIQAVEGKDEDIANMVTMAKEIEESMPGIDSGRKEPSFKRLSKGIVDKAIKKIRKEILGLSIASPSQKALKELMNTEWTADLDLMRDMLDNKKAIKKLLGWKKIGGKAYEKLSFEEKQVQESVNRGIEKSLDEIKWLLKGNEGQKDVSIWFEYFFSKNGRFFVDSNTINPQTDKHLHRFAVQPKSHINAFKETAKGFFVGQQNVTEEVHYAIAQAFGFATDKKDTDKITASAETILKMLNTSEAIEEAKQKFLASGKVVLTYKTEVVEENGKKVKKQVPDKVIEIEHLGHALQAFKFLSARAANKGKVFNSAITAEFDAVTSGFGLKNLQMPIIGSIDSWLQKVGIIFNTDPVLNTAKKASMNDVLDSGDVRDSYQTLASDVKQVSFEAMLSELRAEEGTVPSVTDSDFSRNLWSALSEVLPQLDSEGRVSSALRNLFKYPFMTFNYSASIKSIRKNLLTGELLTGLAKQMAAADISKLDDPIVKLMRAYVGKKGDLGKLQMDIRNKAMDRIKKPGSPHSLEKYLGQMIEASYGAQVERILTEQFAPFVKAQEKINTAFKAMFEVFFVAFEKELDNARRNGPVSVAQEKAIYDKLKSKWPMIKGPLSNMEQEIQEGDGIGIYDTQTGSPYGAYAGRKPARAKLTPEMAAKMGQKDVRVSQMIKQMSAAIAAGSVVPIHYIDGAIMSQTINSLASKGVKGITAIHDAIMVPLVSMAEGQKAYNQQVLEVNANYSFINEIVHSLDRFMEQVATDGTDYTKHKVQHGKDTVSAKSLLKTARNDMASLANDVNEGRKDLYGRLNQGAKIMHMAGTAKGVYDVVPGAVKYKPVEKLAKKSYNDYMKVKGMKYKEMQTLAQNIC